MRQATAALTALSDVDNGRRNAQNPEYAFVAPAGELALPRRWTICKTRKNDLASYNGQLVSLQTQPERVQNAMYNASQQLQQIRSRLDGTDVGEIALRPKPESVNAGPAGVAECGD
ncbi:hypothetical protein ACNKHV_02475 [Shigella flexneri]